MFSVYSIAIGCHHSWTIFLMHITKDSDPCIKGGLKIILNLWYYEIHSGVNFSLVAKIFDLNSKVGLINFYSIKMFFFFISCWTSWRIFWGVSFFPNLKRISLASRSLCWIVFSSFGEFCLIFWYWILPRRDFRCCTPEFINFKPNYL